jgi:hypothetical protein
MAYATEADLTNYLPAGTVVTDAAGKLTRASRRVDSLILTAIYDVDDAGAATDPDIILALRDATCEVVRWWLDTGDETGAGSLFQSVSIGKIQLGRGYSAAGSATGAGQTTSPQAVEILTLAGLIGQPPIQL